MSAIKDGRMPIELNGKTYYMLFSLNVMDELEEKCGAIDDLGEYLSGTGRMKKIKWLLTTLLNEGMPEGEEPLTEQQIGKMIHSGNMNEVTTYMFEAFTYSHRGTTEPPPDNITSIDGVDDESGEENGEEKNAVTGEVTSITSPVSFT